MKSLEGEGNPSRLYERWMETAGRILQNKKGDSMEFADGKLQNKENNSSSGSYDLERFVNAQEDSYDTALKEIKQGAKCSCWMWYIFPQLVQLGRSNMARYYGISGLDEAKEYLAHPVLGPRLREISEALLALDKSDPYEVMGGIDGRILFSSMTLFAEIEGYDSVFGRVLGKYFNGKKDEDTVSFLFS